MPATNRRPKLAILINGYGPTSHGVCYATKFMEGKQFDDHFEPPLCEVVSMHQLQQERNDIGTETANRNGVKLYPSVATALCLGGDTLAVDGVVIIGEHGSFPRNEKGQQLYPRRELFDQVIAVFRQSDRVVPIFNDKHLSWNWTWAKYMWRTVKEMDIPFMHGSSLPFAKYVPFVNLPRGQKLDPVISVGYSGLESYGFHTLETGQFVNERRAGGEKGVRSVQCLTGKAVWEAHKAGRWPQDLAATAFAAVQEPKGRPEDYAERVWAMDIEYRDGQRMTSFIVNGYCAEFAFAYRPRGENRITAAAYKLDPVPRLKHFSATVRAIEEMFLTGEVVEPAERTYLTTGILAYVMDSHHKGDVRLETPDLDIRYRPKRRPEHWKESLH